MEGHPACLEGHLRLDVSGQILCWGRAVVEFLSVVEVNACAT